jgi:hypothetical protein
MESALSNDPVTFDTLCDALRRNDPNCAEVAVIWDRARYRLSDNSFDFCPAAYGPRLGQALYGNEFVQTIELQLGHLLADPIMDHIQDANGVLDFLRSSPTLTTVKLRTSGSYDGDREIDEGETLLLAVVAVAENPHGPLALHLDHADVEEGSYPVDVPPETLASALRATTSIQELVIWLGDGRSPGFYFGEGYDEDIDEDLDKEKTTGREAIAQALRDNCSLKRLRILEDSDAQTVDALVEALRHNGSLLLVEYEDFTDIQRRQSQMYCTRNLGISDVLTELCKLDVAQEVSQSKVDWLPIMPMFLAVVRHSPRMAIGRVVQSLMGLGDVLSPAAVTKLSGAKRAGMQQ